MHICGGGDAMRHFSQINISVLSVNDVKHKIRQIRVANLQWDQLSNDWDGLFL